MDLTTLSDGDLIELHAMYARQHAIECNAWWDVAVVDINDLRLEQTDWECKQMFQVCSELYDEKARRRLV